MLGQVAFAVLGPLTLRLVIAAAFAVPAAVAGYHLVFALSQIGVPSPAWRRSSLPRRDWHWRHGLGAHDRVRGARPFEPGGAWRSESSAGSYGRDAPGMTAHRLVIEQVVRRSVR